MTVTAKPIIGTPSALAGTARDVPRADVFSCQQMSISIDASPENDMANVSNNASSPIDGNSDSGMDWQEGPHTPSTGSEEPVDADEHTTTTQDAPQDASWASNTDDNSSETTSYRFVHAPLLPAPLNPISARPVAMPPVRSMSADGHEDGCWAGSGIARDDASEHVPGHEDDNRDRHSSAVYFSLPSERAPTPYHRESPRAQAPSRVASHAPSPYPASTPPNPFAVSPIYPDETSPLFSPRNINPFAARPPSRRSGSYRYYPPPEPLMSPPPVLNRQSPSLSPPPEHMLDASQSREAQDAWRRLGLDEDEHVPAPPPAPFSIRVPSSGNASGNGSHVGTHVSGSDAVTHEHIEQQRQLQKFVGLLNDMLHDEVRVVAKTVLDLTSDLYDLREDITSLRHDMENLKEERQRSKDGNGNGSSGGSSGGSSSSHASVPMRPFSTHYYPSAYNSSPRSISAGPPGDWRARHLRTCEPIREHSDVGSPTEEELRRHWSVPRPQGLYEYMVAHDVGPSRHEQERDGRDGLDGRDGRDSYTPALARMMHDETYTDNRYGETLPPSTLRHEEPPRRSLHPITSSSDRDDDALSSPLYDY